MRFWVQIWQSELVSMKASQVNRLLTHEFAKIGRWWHRVARPRHFNRGAFQRYGYTPRKRGYIRRKKRKVGHARPLFLSGETWRNTAHHNVRATRKSVTVTYPTARTLNYKSRGSQVNMRKEFETISASEEQHMTDLMFNSLERKLETAARNNGHLALRS